MTGSPAPVKDSNSNKDFAIRLGLRAEEYSRILEGLGREPNFTELAIFSAMWSEHCSYKSSRHLLARLPTEGKCVICGPGENAGVIDIGNGKAAVFKMESHNHPSCIEPYHGAATGIGGVMRDIFTMGARPVANLNALRFGAPEHEKTRHLLAGVVAGLGDYGNCVGIPMLGGATGFDSGYNDNILVNAMCVGIAEADSIFYAKAGAPGNPVFYVGSKTGRDGIHGASMASASFESTDFDEENASKRPTVQVGDPFAEKLLLEACLELMTAGCVVGIQDMGAAGLTSSSVEIAGKGGVGIRLDLDLVPCRQADMSAWEIMLSESQERMLVILKPGSESQAHAIFQKWQLDCIAIGEIKAAQPGDANAGGMLEILHRGERQAHIPIPLLTEPPPVSTPAPPPFTPAVRHKDAPHSFSPPQSIKETLLSLLAGPHLGSRRWIWQQYDHTVMANSIRLPGHDAGVIRIPGKRHSKQRGIAVSVDVTPRYVAADSCEGAKQAVVASWRNLIATGARPLAITNCLNFGNPEKSEVMHQFEAAIEGIREACLALNYPVVSGNVSFYNETGGRDIPPTPSIGGIGLMDDIDAIPSSGFATAGEAILLFGETRGHLGRSICADLAGMKDGSPPPVNLPDEQRTGLFMLENIRHRRIRAASTLSAGGLLTGLARMCLRGGKGAVVSLPPTPLHEYAFLFGEDQGRYLATCSMENAESILQSAREQNISAVWLGTTGDDFLLVHAASRRERTRKQADGDGNSCSSLEEGGVYFSLKEMRTALEFWLPNYMCSAY